MPEPFKIKSLQRKNVKGLVLNLNKQPSPADGGNAGDNNDSGNDYLEEAIQPPALPSDPNRESIPSSASSGSDQIGRGFKLEVHDEDFSEEGDLGAGIGGTVTKVKHITTGEVMARKVIRVAANEQVRKQIVRELQIGRHCQSPNIVQYFGASQNDAKDIVLVMEYMDWGSFDGIYKKFGPIQMNVLGKVTLSILGGLVYLYQTHHIMHRDIKPSNVLFDAQKGTIKLCDFGVAAEAVNSVANTFVGTSRYMAPERIQGGTYTVRSDVWSVGLTIMELAIGRFPFDYTDSIAQGNSNPGPMSIFDVLQQIVNEPSPKLPHHPAFPKVLHEFIDKCLTKNEAERKTPKELYDTDAYLKAARYTKVDLRAWPLEQEKRLRDRKRREEEKRRRIKNQESSHSSSTSRSGTSTSATTTTSAATPADSSPQRPPRTPNKQPARKQWVAMQIRQTPSSSRT